LSTATSTPHPLSTSLEEVDASRAFEEETSSCLYAPCLSAACPTLLALCPFWQFDESLRLAGQESLEARGVEVVTNTRAVEVKQDSVDLLTRDPVTGESRQWSLACGVAVWSGGTSPRQLTAALTDSLNQGGAQGGGNPFGKVLVDPWLRAVGAPEGSLLALGDAVEVVKLSTIQAQEAEPGAGLERLEDAKAANAKAANGGGTAAAVRWSGGEWSVTDDSVPFPQTAQVAAQQGAYAARLLNRRYDLSPPVGSPPVLRAQGDSTYLDFGLLPLVQGLEARPFQFLNLGLLAYLGGGEALSQVQVGDSRLFAQAGSVGFLLWRSVYLTKQVSVRTRVLVLFDWLKTQLFGRDVTRL